jgi:hypothetical protein
MKQLREAVDIEQKLLKAKHSPLPRHPTTFAERILSAHAQEWPVAETFDDPTTTFDHAQREIVCTTAGWMAVIDIKPPWACECKDDMERTRFKVLGPFDDKDTAIAAYLLQIAAMRER